MLVQTWAHGWSCCSWSSEVYLTIHQAVEKVRISGEINHEYVNLRKEKSVPRLCLINRFRFCPAATITPSRFTLSKYQVAEINLLKLNLIRKIKIIRTISTLFLFSTPGHPCLIINMNGSTRSIKSEFRKWTQYVLCLYAKKFGREQVICPVLLSSLSYSVPIQFQYVLTTDCLLESLHCG
jgi:hypothetical protein